jgi:hypothetical protein
MLPIILAAVGAGKGALDARRQQIDARRQEIASNQLAGLDTAYSPFVASKGRKFEAQNYGEGAFSGAVGGGLSGGISGYEQMQKFKQSGQQGQMNNAYLDYIEDQKKKGFPNGFPTMGGK